jgi:hypothetical protein
MTKLPENFELDRYGLHVRLVREEDAEFIVKLRNDPQKGRYISVTSNSVDDQIRWIKLYKKRECEGKDYYFIYSYQGQLAGVNRIYEIEDNHFIHGSWVFGDNTPPYCALAAGIIARELAYDTLGLDVEIDTAGVHKDNHGVLQYIRALGAEFTGTRIYPMGEFYTSQLPKELFYKNKNKIIRLFPKKVL